MKKSKRIVTMILTIVFCLTALLSFGACGPEGVKSTDLETLSKSYKTQMIEQSKQNFPIDGATFSVIILGKEDTLANLENYKFSEQLDKTKIERGLFVEVSIPSGEKIYYNYGLQLSESLSENVTVSTGEPGDPFYAEWTLYVVKDNAKILFEYTVE